MKTLFSPTSFKTRNTKRFLFNWNEIDDIATGYEATGETKTSVGAEKTEALQKKIQNRLAWFQNNNPLLKNEKPDSYKDGNRWL
jgi:hypothetical protein